MNGGCAWHHRCGPNLRFPSFAREDLIVVYFAGRAVTKLGNENIDINEIAIEGSRVWIRENLRAVDAERHIEFQQVVQSGSYDLLALFARLGHVHLANDTSIDVGYAPLSGLEHLVLAIERQINRKEGKSLHPAWGEDVKVMGIRQGDRVELTVACAMIGKYLAHINAADNPKEGPICLTAHARPKTLLAIT